MGVITWERLDGWGVGGLRNVHEKFIAHLCALCSPRGWAYQLQPCRSRMKHRTTSPPVAHCPTQCNKFEDTFLDIAERTYDEKENLHYT